MTIVLTGGLGHIGSKLAIKLLQEEDVVLIDSLKTQRYCSLFNLQGLKRCYFIPQILQQIQTESIEKLGTPTAIIHLAADNDSTQIEAEVLNIEETNNFTATMSAVSIARYFDIPIIFTSTTSVYSTRNSIEVEESFPKSKQLSRYAEIKSFEEEYLKKMSAEGLKYTILRLATIYGTSPGMRFHTAINKFCFSHSIGQPIEVWGKSLDTYRPYLSINDACQAILKTSRCWKDLPRILNLASLNLTIREIFELIEKVSDRKVSYELIENPFQQDDASFRVSNSLAIKNGFFFSDDIRYEVRKTLQMFKGISAGE